MLNNRQETRRRCSRAHVERGSRSSEKSTATLRPPCGRPKFSSGNGKHAILREIDTLAGLVPTSNEFKGDHALPLFPRSRTPCTLSAGNHSENNHSPVTQIAIAVVVVALGGQLVSSELICLCKSPINGVSPRPRRVFRRAFVSRRIYTVYTLGQRNNLTRNLSHVPDQLDLNQLSAL